MMLAGVSNMVTFVGGLGLRDSHCRPVRIRAADMMMMTTSARLWLLLASTTGAIWKEAALLIGCIGPKRVQATHP